MPCSSVGRGTALTSNYKGRGDYGDPDLSDNRSPVCYKFTVCKGVQNRPGEKKKVQKGFHYNNIMAYQFLGLLGLRKKAT